MTEPTQPLNTTTGRRRRRRLTLVSLVVLLVAGGVSAWWYFRRPEPVTEPPVIRVQAGADPAVVAALETARKQVVANPRSGAAWGDLGIIFGVHGYRDEARACFQEAERLDPSEARWPYYQTLVEPVQVPERLIAHLRRALAASASPESAAAIRLGIAELLLDEDRLDEAEAIFREELQTSADNPRARFGLGLVALSRGNHTAAKEAFSRAAHNPHAHKRCAIHLAQLARLRGEPAAAERYEDIARTAPDDPPWPNPLMAEYHSREVGRAVVVREAAQLDTAGQPLQAALLLLEAAQTDPNTVYHFTAATLFLKVGEYSRAEEVLNECLRLEPNHAYATHMLAVAKFERAERTGPKQRSETVAIYREAVRHALRAAELKPDSGSIWLQVGRCELALGNHAEAIKALRQSLACRPEFPDPHLYLGEALVAADQSAEALAEALDHARTAAKLAAPGDPRPKQLLQKLETLQRKKS